jgi:hypothetical protein
VLEFNETTFGLYLHDERGEWLIAYTDALSNPAHLREIARRYNVHAACWQTITKHMH